MFYTYYLTLNSWSLTRVMSPLEMAEKTWTILAWWGSYIETKVTRQLDGEFIWKGKQLKQFQVLLKKSTLALIDNIYQTYVDNRTLNIKKERLKTSTRITNTNNFRSRSFWERQFIQVELIFALFALSITILWPTICSPLCTRVFGRLPIFSVNHRRK